MIRNESKRTAAGKLVSIALIILLVLQMTGCGLKNTTSIDLKPGNTDEETIDNLCDYSKYIEQNYTDKNGYVKLNDLDNVLDEFYQGAYELYENGEYNRVERNDSNVFVELKSGFGFCYIPKVEGLKGNDEAKNDGDNEETIEISVIAYDVINTEILEKFNSSLPGKEYIYFLNDYLPNTQGTVDRYYGTDSTVTIYKNTENDIEALKHLLEPGKKIIIFDTHGAYDKVRGSMLKTGITIDELKERYKDENGNWNDDIYTSLASTSEGDILLTPTFFRSFDESDYLKDSIVIMSACESVKDVNKGTENKLSEVFLDKGADIVVGFTETVNIPYSSYFLNLFLEDLMVNYRNESFEENLIKARYDAEGWDVFNGHLSMSEAAAQNLFGDELKKHEMTLGDILYKINQDPERYTDTGNIEYDDIHQDYANDVYADGKPALFIFPGKPTFHHYAEAKIYGKTEMTFEQWLLDDDRTRLVREETYMADNVLIQSIDYTYDVRGNLVRKEVLRNPELPQDGQWRYDRQVNEWNYDEKGILISQSVNREDYPSRDDPRTPYEANYSYKYDNNGNRINDFEDELGNIITREYIFDEYGQMTQETIRSKYLAGQSIEERIYEGGYLRSSTIKDPYDNSIIVTKTYNYNEDDITRGELLSVVDGEGNTLETFEYDEKSGYLIKHIEHTDINNYREYTYERGLLVSTKNYYRGEMYSEERYEYHDELLSRKTSYYNDTVNSVTEYEYDDQRLLTKEITKNNNGEVVGRIAYYYNTPETDEQQDAS